MDHIGILKRAWNVVWRHRILWLFGFFVGGGGGSGGGYGNYSISGDEFDPATVREFQRVGEGLQDNIALVLAVAAFLAVVGLAFFIVSIAAKGGLVHLVNEAEEDRPVRGFDGWASGFHNWFKVFAIGLLLWLPFFVVLLIVIVAVVAPIVGPIIAGGEPGGGAIVGMCGGVFFGGVVLLLLGILVGLLDDLAVRHTVLDGTRVIRSIGEAWTDVRTRFKDVIVMWLLMFAVGIAFGIAVGVFAAIFGFAIAASAFTGNLILAIVIGFALFLILLLPSAIFSAFSSAVWTVFFRRLTGREGVAAPQTPGYSPPMAPGAPPPEPPAAPETSSPIPPPPSGLPIAMPEEPAEPSAPPDEPQAPPEESSEESEPQE